MFQTIIIRSLQVGGILALLAVSFFVGEGLNATFSPTIDQAARNAKVETPADRTKALEEHIKYMEYRLKTVEKELETTAGQMDSRHEQLNGWLSRLSERVQDLEAPMLDQAIKEAAARISQNKSAAVLVGGVHIGKRIHELESAK